MNPSTSGPTPSVALSYREQRLENMRQLEAMGYTPYGQAYTRTGTLDEVRAAYEEEKTVSIAGRLILKRGMGKAVFADLNDGSARLQILVKKDVVGDEILRAFRLLDIGDHIGVEGEMFITKTGEMTVRVRRWTLLGKALLPLPEKWHGLTNTELRYRHRHLDLIANPEVRDVFNKRIAIVREARAFLEERGFQEVETPMLQPHAGGAAARPFVTHYNALDRDMFMRIAPELYLKRLLVGGFDKVFELNRDFRNEGLDRTHNPEFTVLEVYEAYGDVHSMIDILEGLLPRLCERVVGSMTVEYGETEKNLIDFTPPYRRVRYADLVKDWMGDDWFELDDATARGKAEAMGVAIDPSWGHLLVTREIYDKRIERTLVQPTFVMRVPREFVPLAKTCPDDPSCADVFEFVVGGKELCPGYTEQNDPIEQRKAFAAQVGDDVEKLDEDFILALEHGMPPAGGLGIGVDRLVMFLTGCYSIRDVILFPVLRDA
ncbi:MAG: lysine--tRNA ligase [Kiritimatiellia bacterium]|jgi:lysyl-tRNA synthetase class 2